jgi:hypothetical protein
VYPVLRILPIIIMLAAGAILLARAVASDVFMLMLSKVGPDKEHWLAADEKQWDQQFEPDHTF